WCGEDWRAIDQAQHLAALLSPPQIAAEDMLRYLKLDHRHLARCLVTLLDGVCIADPARPGRAGAAGRGRAREVEEVADDLAGHHRRRIGVRLLQVVAEFLKLLFGGHPMLLRTATHKSRPVIIPDFGQLARPAGR